MGIERYSELLAAVPANLKGSPEALETLEAILRPAAAVDDFLTLRLEGVPQQRNPADATDDAIYRLAAMLGFGADLPIRGIASIERLRGLCSIAASMWRRKGRESAWRLVVSALTGSRSVILTWHELRTIEGSWGELVSLPVPSTAVGSSYDYPEHVSDIHYMPGFASVDLELLAAVLELVRPHGCRLNLIEGLFLDDMQSGAALWEQGSSGTGTYDEDAHTLTSEDGFEFAADLGGSELTWINFELLAVLATTGITQVLMLRQDAANGYLIELDAGAGRVRIYRRVATVDTLLVDFVDHFVPGFGYRWRFGAWETGSATDVRVWREGAISASYLDSSGSRYSAGGWGFQAKVGPSNVATLSAVLALPDNPTLTRVGPSP